MADSLKTIRSSIIDGIAHTPRYRERQLASLHKALIESRSNLIRLIAEDSTVTTAEATAQFLLVLRAIKEFHTAVNPKQSLESEYLLAHGKNFASRRTPYGCAYIQPSNHDTFYSSVVPTAAAIAAGNGVVLELPQTSSALNVELKKLMRKAISSETFAITEGSSATQEFIVESCLVLNGRAIENAESSTRKLRTPSRRVAAVVDRSAELGTAAKDCVKARFGFGGKSAYAPDVVLCNEFVLKPFLTALTESAMHYFSNQTNGLVDYAEKAASRRRPGLESSVQRKLQSSSAEALVSGDKGTIAVLRDRKSDLLAGKLDTPLLLIVPISSMDDAINMLGNDNQPRSRLRADYLFCAPAAAKYLGQFIPSALTCANHIPVELLIGPPAPEGIAASTQPRYNPDMFSLASPEYIQQSSLSQTLSVLLSSDSDPKARKHAEEELDVAIQRVPEAFGPPIGFFEQGLLFGLSCFLVTAVTAGGFAIRYGGPALMSRIRGH